jgi:hypothetical protein
MKYFSFSIAIILIQFLQVSAQSPDIKAKVEKLRSAAMDRLNTVAYRKLQVTEDFSSKNGPLDYRIDYITTFVPPNSSQVRRRETRGTDVYLSEAIYIGRIRYFRKNNDKWKKETYDGERFTINWSLSDPGTEVESKGEVDLGGKKAHLYVIKRFSVEASLRSVEQLWFGTDGLLLRSVTEGGLGQGTIYRREAITYEYNGVGLRIKAPIP